MMARTDAVVVGGGPCAAVAARELVEAGARVVMLDAGRRAPRGLTVRCAGRTLMRAVEPGFVAVNRQRRSADPETLWTSSLSWGGLSNYWTGACPRFHPLDFTEGARLDERYEWPIRYEDLVPFYERCEDDLVLTVGDGFSTAPAGRARYRHRPPSDWVGVIEAARAAGHPIGPIPIARGRPWMVVPRAREFDAHACLRGAVASSRRLDVVHGARVLRVRPDDRATLVEYADASGGVVALDARVVVLAAGALDTTEILLRSAGNDFPDGLGNGQGVLGRYLHDHPKDWWPATIDRPLTALHHPIYVARRDYETDPPLSATSLTIGLGRERDRLATLWNGTRSLVGVQVFGTMTPTEAVGVSLDGPAASNDPRSLLAIELTFDSAAELLMDRARQRFVDVMAAAGIEAQPGAPHPLAPGASNHFGGTARMHRDPRYGVVDEWNRLHEAPSVLVADASCFTTTPEKNPTLTAMALAARAARHAGEQLGAPINPVATPSG